MSLLSPALEAFIAVSDHHTVHGAARALHLTQTGVTQRIRSLEAQLSTTLFTRSRRGMRLTHEGQALLRYCQAVRDLEGQTLSQIDGAGRKSEVRVCLTGPTSIIESRVVPQTLNVMKAFPRLVLSFDVDDIENRAERLRNGSAQLAILPREQVAKEMDSKLLRPERYLLVGCRAWKGRPIRDIVRTERIIDFDATDHMTQSYLKKLGLLDQARPERHFVNHNGALVEILRAGHAYGVLTAEVAEPYLKREEIAVLYAGGAYLNELALAWYPRPHLPDYLQGLIRALR